jgi:hypothetical protein
MNTAIFGGADAGRFPDNALKGVSIGNTAGSNKETFTLEATVR